MAKTPARIIVNTNRFIVAPDPVTVGGHKDFFDQLGNPAFVLHRDGLVAMVNEVSAELEKSPFGSITYVKVQMREEALAKTHRPNKFLMPKDQYTCVGGDDIGVLYYRMTLPLLDSLRARIAGAEEIVVEKVHQTTGEIRLAPSRARSEVGAIGLIEIARPVDKRDFSTSAAVSVFEDPWVASGYLVELFETPADGDERSDGLSEMFQTLQETVSAAGLGTRAQLWGVAETAPILDLLLTNEERPPIVDLTGAPSVRSRAMSPRPTLLDQNPVRHEAVLNALARHPLVRNIEPPIRLHISEIGAKGPSGDRISIPQRYAESTYPIVGIIDSGVSEIFAPWIVDRHDSLDPEDYDNIHGTTVAGIVLAGRVCNAGDVGAEEDGCLIYDIPLFPTGRFFDHYANGFIDFLNEIEAAVGEATRNYGVRVFNLSVNAVADVGSSSYGLYAARLDQIADEYGVVFVNSCGNLHPSRLRTPWHSKPRDVTNYFAARTSPDTIMQPCESVRSFAVGALNPNGTLEVAGAPTNYTTRGPGLQVGIKPDLVAYGGTTAALGETTGLASIDQHGNTIEITGTSFAAPFVARINAGIDVATGGRLNVETIRALTVHGADHTTALKRQGLKNISRQFAGFGMSGTVEDALTSQDHALTMIFQDRLRPSGPTRGQIMRLGFSWPASLVDRDGRCSGRVRMTLVYLPPLDRAFGAEFVRVNLDASLAQADPGSTVDGGTGWPSRVSLAHMPDTKTFAPMERERITHGLKWWPTKKYVANLNAKGKSSDWRVQIKSLHRAETSFPEDGVPFALILTIEDPDGVKPIAAELRRELDNVQAQTEVAIRTAIQVRNGE